MWSVLAALLALAAAGTLDLFHADGKRQGYVRKGEGGRVDLYDQRSRRVGWGKRGADGSLELFDMQGNRIGTVTRDQKALRLKRPQR